MRAESPRAAVRPRRGARRGAARFLSPTRACAHRCAGPPAAALRRRSLGLAAGQDSPEPLSAPLLDSLKPGASRSLSSRQLSALALRETELRLKPKSKFHQAWRIIDDHYVKPYVGGQLRSAQAAHSGGEGSCGGGD